MFAATKAAFKQAVEQGDPPVFLLAAGASNSIYDAGPNGLTITNSNATTTTGVTNFSGKYSVQFNGSAYLRLPNDAVFNFSTGDFTVEQWVYPSSVTGFQYFSIGNGEGTVITGNTFLAIRSNGTTLQAYIDESFVGGVSATLTSGEWQHIAVSRSGTTVRYFKNGTEVGTFTNSGDIDVGSFEPVIGALSVSPSLEYPFSGYIQDLRISNTALYTGTFTPPGSLT